MARIDSATLRDSFDGVQKRKYDKWKKGEESEERQAFDGYFEQGLKTKIKGNAKTISGSTPSCEIKKDEHGITIDVGVPASGGGGGGGGGDIRPTIVIPQDEPKSIKGEYGMNLFNYRDLTYNSDIFVNGDYFENRRPSKVNHTYSAVYKKTNPTVRMRQHDTVTLKHRLIKSDSNHDIEFSLVPKDGHGTAYTLDINPKGHNEPIYQWKKESPVGSAQYSYGVITFGTKDSRNPKSTSKIELKAWYGTVEPKGILDQRFVFKRFNSLDIRALQTYNDVGEQPLKTELLEDEVKVYKRKTTITRKVGILKLKDAKEWHWDSSKNTLLIPIPEDCKPSGNKFMTNNLCDVKAEAPFSQYGETQPFFVRSLGPSTEQQFKKVRRDSEGNIVLDGNNKPIFDDDNKTCFQIMLKESNVHDWKHLLEKTEILYEINEPKVDELLPFGGQIYVLDSGLRVHTCMYKTIEAKTQPKGADKYFITFKESPFGLPDMNIEVEHIKEIIDASGNDKLP